MPHRTFDSRENRSRSNFKSNYICPGQISCTPRRFSSSAESARRTGPLFRGGRLERADGRPYCFRVTINDDCVKRIVAETCAPRKRDSRARGKRDFRSPSPSSSIVPCGRSLTPRGIALLFSVPVGGPRECFVRGGGAHAYPVSYAGYGYYCRTAASYASRIRRLLKSCRKENDDDDEVLSSKPDGK